MSTLPPFPSYDLSQNQGTLATRWIKYIARFCNLIVALNVTNKKRQQALLLHYAGEEINDIVETLLDAVVGADEDPLEKTVTALTNHFTPRTNVVYEEYKFKQAKHDSEEDLVTYYPSLKYLSQPANSLMPTEKSKARLLNCVRRPTSTEKLSVILELP